MVLRQRLMEQMESRMQVEDEELRDLIDMAILEAAEGAYLPLKERLCLRKELFDSFRRLDILQELVDDPTITEIMVNGTEHIFVERQGRVEELEKHFDSVGQLEDLIQQIVLLRTSAGLKHREIAADLEMPLATVLSKYNRAMKKLKKHLREEGVH